MSNFSNYGGDAEVALAATGYFGLTQADGQWSFVDPDGHPFISVGVNHADSTNLRYAHNEKIWNERYGTQERWIREAVVPDLRSWGFNTIGWTQEYISGDWGTALDWFGEPIDLGHSTPWSATEHEAAGMPFCRQLRVQEMEDWNGFPNFRDMNSRDFEVYCDYLARSVCAPHADSTHLLGYFLVDIPAWLPHVAGHDFKEVHGLSAEQRETKIYDIASTYYEKIVAAIKRYDSNHLILGDRYNGNKGIPRGVLRAMQPFVDVFSVQYFTSADINGRTTMIDDLAQWHADTGKPVLVADIGNWCATELNPNRISELSDQAARGEDYVAAASMLTEQPWLIGWHWCAYLENTARGWGLKDPWDEPYIELTGPMAEFNKSVYSRRRSTAA